MGSAALMGKEPSLGGGSAHGGSKVAPWAGGQVEAQRVCKRTNGVRKTQNCRRRRESEAGHMRRGMRSTEAARPGATPDSGCARRATWRMTCARASHCRSGGHRAQSSSSEIYAGGTRAAASGRRAECGSAGLGASRPLPRSSWLQTQKELLAANSFQGRHACKSHEQLLHLSFYH